MSAHPLRRDERGLAGGIEGLVFGVLILLIGSLAIINIWAMIDTRAALDAASREFLRTYTEQQSVGEARLMGEAAARESLRARAARIEGLSFVVEQPDGFGPCSPVTVRISATVHWFKVPLLPGFGDSHLAVENRELIDAHTEVITDDLYDPANTACADG
ncbi:MAG TPA: hypothetical protein VL068_07750 [Microthrixaceae bacterium]|nr:hypothetical protein [Microthrixaceae bacterium]